MELHVDKHLSRIADVQVCVKIDVNCMMF